MYLIDTEEALIVDVESTGAMTRALWRGRLAGSIGLVALVGKGFMAARKNSNIENQKE